MRVYSLNAHSNVIAEILHPISFIVILYVTKQSTLFIIMQVVFGLMFDLSVGLFISKHKYQ